MYKKINFKLNKFSQVPNKLRTNPVANIAASEFNVDLSRLYHHYYTDSWGVKPLDPDYTNFEYLRFLANTNDFRFINQRINTSGAHKRTVSYKLGQAFCRYFLYEFCGITYFAHMDKILDKDTHPAFNGMRIIRISKDDVPDYLCCNSIIHPYIAEAKGRFKNISFTAKHFTDWRNQFNRIRIIDSKGVPKKLKGYIVGTKFSTDKNNKSNKSKIMAEDPETTGESSITDNDFGLSRGCIALHYAKLISKLGLQLISQSLYEGFNIPEEYFFNLPIWQCNYPPLKGEKFVGGYLSDRNLMLSKLENGHHVFYPDILKINDSLPSFYGIKESTFRRLRKIANGNWGLLDEIEQLPDTEYRISNLAWLRDGSISGSLEYFELVGIERF